MTIVQSQVFRYDDESPRQVLKQTTLSIPHNCVSQSFAPIIYIHGGAWVDPTHTSEEPDSLIKSIDTLINGDNHRSDQEFVEVSFFGIDYRLSPEVKHPYHLLDVLKAVHFVYSLGYTEVTLMGHSVGATFCTQILSPGPILQSFGLQFDKALPKVKNVIFLDGIYDVRAMLEEYPSYQNAFVSKAFECERDWLENVNMLQYDLDETNRADLLEIYSSKQILVIVHSKQDELLSYQGQPVVFHNWLNKLGTLPQLDYVIDDFGLHDQVWSSEKLACLVVQRFFSD